MSKDNQLETQKKREKKKREKNSNYNPSFNKGVYWMPMGEILHNDGPKEF